MIKVYQTIVDKGHGNCMQAAIASLFNKQLDEVPNFIECESWFSTLWNFVGEQGYEYDTMLHNKNYSMLMTPTHECFHKVKWHKPSVMTRKCLYKEEGVGGYFVASILSPKYFNWSSGSTSTHAVVIDRDFNIVHDVNPEYKDILTYPLSKLLGYNGIINVYLINPK